MGFSSWLYTNSTKQVLKIVHPGGHAELHDRPVLAAEIINRNPRCCVAHPNIFQQPWAIVAPDTTLMPGQKFYVVPVSTIRRLQKLSLKYKTCQNQDANQNNQGFIASGEGDSFRTTCWQSKHSNGETSNDSYCACLRSGKKIEGNNNEESSKERLASNLTCSQKNESKKGSSDISIRGGGPPKKLIALDNWHPGLESIGEEIAPA